MKQILVLGAGRSSIQLIHYLLSQAEEKQWRIVVADMNISLAQSILNNSAFGLAVELDVHNVKTLEQFVIDSELVVSLLPPFLHEQVARICINLRKNLITASYVSDEMQKLKSQAEVAGITILMECGLDPGIDHMSAMQVIDDIKKKGGKIVAFESFAGGLLAPESELNNPWQYKFTWNPSNVIGAGRGTVKFLQEGKYKYIPYQRLFRRTEIIQLPHFGYFEGYGNRDSLKYRSIYGLEDIRTIYRGTLRRPGFCKSWDTFVQLGATENNYEVEGVEDMTHRDFINSFLFYNPHDSVELKLAHYMNLEIDGQEMFKLKWLGLFDREKIGLEKGTPAQILEHILKKKWTMTPTEKDMIVMYHKFEYELNGKKERKNKYSVILGEADEKTAMSKTVGLPLGIAAKLILEKKIERKGVIIPTTPDIYNPVLKELEAYGIHFLDN